MSADEAPVVSFEGGVLTVVLNRPHRLNALDEPSRHRLRDIWVTHRDDPRLRCVVLSGTGRAFCSGADMTNLDADPRADPDAGVALDFLPGRHLDVPIVVAVNGLCVGGGLYFVADADIVVAAAGAYFSGTHVTMGQVSGVGVELVRKRGFRAAAELALSGSAYRMTAAEALTVGLVDHVTDDDPRPAAGEIAHRVGSQSPSAVRTTLELLRAATERAVGEDEVWTRVRRQWEHPDATEGPRAFVERRAPRWADR
jgi:enoyl-CoA hydratase/carnithine racemase